MVEVWVFAIWLYQAGADGFVSGPDLFTFYSESECEHDRQRTMERTAVTVKVASLCRSVILMDFDEVEGTSVSVPK